MRIPLLSLGNMLGTSDDELIESRCIINACADTIWLIQSHDRLAEVEVNFNGITETKRKRTLYRVDIICQHQ